jgi:hypothetical protein
VIRFPRRLVVTNGEVPVVWTEEYTRFGDCRSVMRLVGEGQPLEMVGATGHAAAAEGN